MMKPGNTGFKRLFYAMIYSYQGLKSAWKNEEAFRLECLILLPVIPSAIYFGETGLQQALLIGSWLLVMIVELINSAIEAVVDRFGGQRHELSGRAKDIGSAAVLLAVSFAFMVWILIFNELGYW